MAKNKRVPRVKSRSKKSLKKAYKRMDANRAVLNSLV